MMYKDEDPENLGEFLRPDGSKRPEVERSEMLPAEVLKMINQLLERMQQLGQTNQGSKFEFVWQRTIV